MQRQPHPQPDDRPDRRSQKIAAVKLAHDRHQPLQQRQHNLLPPQLFHPATRNPTQSIPNPSYTARNTGRRIRIIAQAIAPFTTCS